jgi:hypothetical protein
VTMAFSKIQPAELPAYSLAYKSFSRIDFIDSYTCLFNSDKPLSVDDTVMAFFNASSPLISTLFSLRNKLMKPFGLKVSDINSREAQLKQFQVEPGNSLGLFKVMGRSDNEVLIGEDDKHLNFRISFLLTKHPELANHYSFTLSTIVLINNSFGKLYFVFIKPVHKFIVPSMMKGIVKQLSLN